MDNPLKILLVEDEIRECTAISLYAEKFDDVRIIAVTNTENVALKHVYDHLPDAVILDLELQKGGGSGIHFLQELQRRPPVPFPYILVTTNNISRVTLNSARQLGADYFIIKSDSSVERAMQNAINSAWRKTSIEELQRYYTARISSVRGVPTISEFIHHYGEKLKTEY